MADEDEYDNGAPQLPGSDTLDAPDGAVDPDDGTFVPPDRPLVSEQDDMTARGMHEGETLDERLVREEPDGIPAVEPVTVVDRAADAEIDRARDDDAARIDALRDAAGAAAPASGRVDAGDVPGL